MIKRFTVIFLFVSLTILMFCPIGTHYSSMLFYRQDRCLHTWIFSWDIHRFCWPFRHKYLLSLQKMLSHIQTILYNWSAYDADFLYYRQSATRNKSGLLFGFCLYFAVC